MSHGRKVGAGWLTCRCSADGLFIHEAHVLDPRLVVARSIQESRLQLPGGSS